MSPVAVGGVVPLPALMFRDKNVAAGWAKSLTADVIAEAREKAFWTAVVTWFVLSSIASRSHGERTRRSGARLRRGGSAYAHGCAVTTRSVICRRPRVDRLRRGDQVILLHLDGPATPAGPS